MQKGFPNSCFRLFFINKVLSTRFLFVLIILILNLLPFGSISQVSINNNGNVSDSSAILDVQSTRQGILFPRLSNDQRNAIQEPAVGLMIFNTDTKILEVFNGTTWTNLKGIKTSEVICGLSTVEFGGITYGTVEYNGRCWLDRNLGASQLATSENDSLSYGYYYQWGRAGDGHQHPLNSTTSSLANSTTPGHSNFILPSSSPYDWLNQPDPNLWSPHRDYDNNPCPDDWKVPSHSEWSEAVSGWSNLSDAFNSSLKLPSAGYRSRTDGNLYGTNTGAYWSNTLFDNNSRMYYFDNTSLESFHKYRAWGFSVRCIDAMESKSNLLFSRAYGGTDNERAWAMAQASNGNFVVAGMTESYGSGSDDILLLRTDTSGNIIFGKAYDEASASDECYSLKTTSDNGFILAGEAGTDVYNLKLDSIGNVEWDERTSYGGNERNRDVLQDTDGGFVFIGYTDGFGSGGAEHLVTKRDNSGNTVWGWAIGTVDNEFGYGIVKDTDGGYAICGASNNNSAGGYDLQFFKLNSAGNSVYGWNMGGTDDDYARDLTLAHDSGYVMVGYTNSFGAGGADLYVRKVNADGTTGWGSVIGGPEEDFGFSIVLTEDHGFAIAGQTRSFGAGSGDVWLVKIDSTGDFEWSWAFGGSNHESGESVVIGDDGYYYLAGYTRSYGVGGGTDDALLVKIAPDGGSCLGSYIGLPIETDNMSFMNNDVFKSTSVNELSFQRISGNETPVKMKNMRLPDTTSPGRGVISTTVTDFTPVSTTICEDE